MSTFPVFCFDPVVLLSSCYYLRAGTMICSSLVWPILSRTWYIHGRQSTKTNIYKIEVTSQMTYLIFCSESDSKVY
jgi:hypothetical protein